MLGLGAPPVSVLAIWKTSLVFMELKFCSSLFLYCSLALKTKSFTARFAALNSVQSLSLKALCFSFRLSEVL